jgi:hypothetical protein
MRSKTCNNYPSGLQTAVKFHQKETLDGLRIQRSEEPCNGSRIWRIKGSSGGLCTQSDGGVVDERHSNSNVKHKEILTKLSVGLQERSTTLYSPVREPKALDKRVRRVDDRYDAEAHNAPWPTEGDCGGQSLNQQDVFGRQQSLRDSRHTSHDTTRCRGRDGVHAPHTSYTPHPWSVLGPGQC